MPSAVENADAWDKLGAKQRRQFATRLGSALGADWKLLKGASRVVRLRHSPTSSVFVIVPGGVMQMGLADEEIALVRRYLGSRPHILEAIDQVKQHASPVREVRVRPFLCGERLFEPDQIARLTDIEADTLGAMPRRNALAFAKASGFRLPSDAELEWLARQGHGAPFVLDAVFEADEDDPENILITDQPIAPRFGVGDLFTVQWAADDWFPDHGERRRSSVARSGGDPQGVRRFEEFDFEAVGPEAVIGELSARRDPGGKWRARVRFALDLPAKLLDPAD
jgi:hypothetical protein